MVVPVRAGQGGKTLVEAPEQWLSPERKGPDSGRVSGEGISGWPVAQAKVWFGQDDYAVEEELEDPRRHGGHEVRLELLVLSAWWVRGRC